MKKIVCLLLVVVLVSCVSNINLTPQMDNKMYLRLHIRANSNSQDDQDVKYLVKEQIVNYLTPKLQNVTTKDMAIQTILDCKAELERVSNQVLLENGFEYTTNIQINNELFPTRSYGEYTLDSGYYDAVIVGLGEAKGDNWWCVVYPPLCFVNYSGYGNVIYKSKLWEIINSFFK